MLQRMSSCENSTEQQPEKGHARHHGTNQLGLVLAANEFANKAGMKL